MAAKVILLVEDNPDDAEQVAVAYRKIKAANKLVIVPNGEDAIKWLETNDAPLFILLDMQLPGMSGLDVLKAIRKSPLTKKVRVVILSGSSSEWDIVDSFKYGVNKFIVKKNPINFMDFLDEVKTIGVYLVLTDDKPD